MNRYLLLPDESGNEVDLVLGSEVGSECPNGL